MFEQIGIDFAPFKQSNISLEMVEQAYCSCRRSGFRFQVRCAVSDNTQCTTPAAAASSQACKVAAHLGAEVSIPTDANVQSRAPSNACIGALSASSIACIWPSRQASNTHSAVPCYTLSPDRYHSDICIPTHEDMCNTPSKSPGCLTVNEINEQVITKLGGPDACRASAVSCMWWAKQRRGRAGRSI